MGEGFQDNERVDCKSNQPNSSFLFGVNELNLNVQEE